MNSQVSFVDSSLTFIKAWTMLAHSMCSRDTFRMDEWVVDNGGASGMAMTWRNIPGQNAMNAFWGIDLGASVSCGIGLFVLVNYGAVWNFAVLH